MEGSMRCELYVREYGKNVEQEGSGIVLNLKARRGGSRSLCWQLVKGKGGRKRLGVFWGKPTTYKAARIAAWGHTVLYSSSS